MALKIKAGAVLHPFGKGNGSFDDQSQISQAILEYLKERYPDEIEGESEVVEEAPEAPTFPEDRTENGQSAEQVEKPKGKKK